MPRDKSASGQPSVQSNIATIIVPPIGFLAELWISTIDGAVKWPIAIAAAGLIMLLTPEVIDIIQSIVAWSRSPDRRHHRHHRQPRPRRLRRIAWTRTLIALIALITGMLAGNFLLPRPASACAHPTQLRVATFPAGVGPYQQVADEYAKQTANSDSCPTVAIDVYGAPVDDIRDGIAKGWAYPTDSVAVSQSTAPDRGRGYQGLPRPDIWLPESPMDTEDLPETVDAGQEIAWTPMTLAAAQPLAVELGRASMPQIVDRALNASFQIVHPTPTTASTVGQLGTWSLYARERRPDIITEQQARSLKLDPSLARQLLGTATNAGEELDLICGFDSLPEPDRGQTALLVTEQALRWAAQQAKPCGAGLESLFPSSGWADSYGAGGFAISRRFVRPNWGTQAGVAAPQKRAITGFQRWLTAAFGQQALIRAGLRQTKDPTGRSKVQLTHGDLTAVRARYWSSHPRLSALVLVDTSGSMDVELTSAVKQGLRDLSAAITPADALGLWTFPGSASGSQTAELLPVTTASSADASSHGDRIAAALAQIPDDPKGTTTPLYHAVASGVDHLGSADHAAVIAITDGQPTDGPAALPADAPSNVQRYIIAVGGATCPSVATDRVECRQAAASELGHQLTAIVNTL